jgi:predicted peroxiredoxin
LQPRRNRERIAPVSNKLIIVLVNTDPRNGEELGAPFFHAAVAAAMNFDVQVICAATAGRLMKKGVAETLTVKPGASKTVYDFIRDAHQHGARLYACPANLELFDMTEEDLIPECAGLMGSAAMIAQIMEENCRVLTY